MRLARGPLLTLMVALVVAPGCWRWVEMGPITLASTGRTPEKVFERALRHSRALGYADTTVDEERLFFRVDARFVGRAGPAGSPGRSLPSVFLVQVHPDGSLTVTPSGELVEGRRVYYRIADEVEWYAYELGRAMAISAK